MKTSNFYNIVLFALSGCVRRRCGITERDGADASKSIGQAPTCEKLFSPLAVKNFFFPMHPYAAKTQAMSCEYHI